MSTPATGSTATTATAGRFEATPAIADCPVLIVDDIEWNRVLIGSLLEDAGYRQLYYAANGKEALAKIAAVPVDLVILDIMMPVLDGFDVCKHLRADPATAELPVLVQTALTGLQDRNRAFDAGTTDLISKPLERTELLARVRIHLENRVLIRSLQHYRERVEGELATARTLYQYLLPTGRRLEALAASTGLEAHSRLSAGDAEAGSLWNFLEIGKDCHAFYLLSVGGRGVSTILNACRLDTLVRDLAQPDLAPEEVASQIRRRVSDLMGPTERVAFHYGLFQHATGAFHHAWTAGSPPLWLSAAGAGRPVPSSGADEEGSGTTSLEPGQGLLFHTFPPPSERSKPEPGNACALPAPADDLWAPILPVLLHGTGAELDQAMDAVSRGWDDAQDEADPRGPTLICLLRRREV